MTTAVTKKADTTIVDMGAVERVLIVGDLNDLSSDQRVAYYRNVCESVGLNPLTRPFEYLTLNGKLVLYARKDATEQIRATRGISLRIPSRDVVGGTFIVTAEATDPAGRVDSATGAVWIEGLKGESVANAMMKAETKAKRRVTLSIAGLGMLDEVEIEPVPGARPGHDTQPAALRIKAESGEIVEPEWMSGDTAVTVSAGDLAILREDIAASGMNETVILAAYRIKDLADLPADKMAECSSRVAGYVARRQVGR